MSNLHLDHAKSLQNWFDKVAKEKSPQPQPQQKQPQQKQPEMEPLPVIEADRDPWNANWLRRPKEPNQQGEEEEDEQEPEAGDEEAEEDQ